MDYEEFCAATGNNYALLKQIYDTDKGIGQDSLPLIAENSESQPQSTRKYQSVHYSDVHRQT